MTRFSFWKRAGRFMEMILFLWGFQYSSDPCIPNNNQARGRSDLVCEIINQRNSYTDILLGMEQHTERHPAGVG